jgi:capsid protein
MLVFTQGSYSAQRVAMIAAHHTVMGWTNWENKVFNQRLWNWRVAKAIKNGALPPAPLDDKGQSQWWRVEWSMPFWQEIDTEKQVKGEMQAWKMGGASLKKIIASKGGERDDTFIEKAQDIVSAEKAAKLAMEQDPTLKINWRDIIDVSTGQTIAPAEEESE